jgi:hypothetical protein
MAAIAALMIARKRQRYSRISANLHWPASDNLGTF